VNKSTATRKVTSCQSSQCNGDVVRSRVLSVLGATGTDSSLVDLLENLVAEGIQEDVIRAAVSAMLAESVIEMTPTRKLRLGETKNGVAETTQGMAARVGSRR
jgi:DNA-binding transcriptional regulator PaaX